MQMGKKYKNLLIDIDNTLLCYEKDCEKAFKMAINKININFENSMFKIFKNYGDITWEKLKNGEIKTYEEQIYEGTEMFFNYFNIEFDVNKFNKIYQDEFEFTGTIYSDVKQTLEDLYEENYNLYVITNGAQKYQEGRLKNVDILKYISKVFTNEKIGFSKPDKRFFYKVFDELNIENYKEVLIIGDTLEHDIKGGFDLNIDTCWCNYKKKKNETLIKPTYEIKKFKELKLILN